MTDFIGIYSHRFKRIFFFSGESSGWINSQFEILHSPFGCFNLNDAWIRFRFKSDSIPDTLAGWIIKSIVISLEFAVESVPRINKPSTLGIYPNPSSDAIFNFPKLDEEQEYSMEVTDVMGRCVLRVPYVHQLNLSGYAKGIYFYRVSNGVENYSGKLVVE